MDKFIKISYKFEVFILCALREKCPNMEYLSDFSRNAGKYGPEKTPYLDTFHAAVVKNLPTLMFARVLNTVIKLSIKNISR